jgi:septal ring factor EnvC (AmiA/AmiB activator)
MRWWLAIAVVVALSSLAIGLVALLSEDDEEAATGAEIAELQDQLDDEFRSFRRTLDEQEERTSTFEDRLGALERSIDQAQVTRDEVRGLGDRIGQLEDELRDLERRVEELEQQTEGGGAPPG